MVSASPEAVWSAGHHWCDPRGPDLEGVVDRAVDLEAEPDRLDHRGARGERVFEATSANRAAASPQTRSR